MLDGFIHTYTIPDFAEKKQEILLRIADLGVHSLVEKGQNLENTDWYLPSDRRRTYLEPVMQDLDIALQKLHDATYFDMPSSKFAPRIVNYWFQQYGLGNFHDWHVHDVMYAAIIYVELDKGAETRFRIKGEEHKMPIEEGQILLFPGLVPHRSPLNTTGKRKTSIALNIATY